MGLRRDNFIFQVARKLPFLKQWPLMRELKARLVGEGEDLQDVHRDLFRKLIQPGAVVVDIGAHRGDHALFFEHLGATVHAFEPGLIFHTLCRRVRWKNVTCYHYALGETAGMVPFFEYDRHKSSISGLTPNAGESQVNIVRAVPIAKLDDFGLSPSFIKIDVEGHEPEVLRGAMATIQKLKPVIFLEVWPWSSRDFLRMMYDIGYVSTNVDHTNVLLTPAQPRG